MTTPTTPYTGKGMFSMLAFSTETWYVAAQANHTLAFVQGTNFASTPSALFGIDASGRLYTIDWSTPGSPVQWYVGLPTTPQNVWNFAQPQSNGPLANLTQNASQAATYTLYVQGKCGSSSYFPCTVATPDAFVGVLALPVKPQAIEVSYLEIVPATVIPQQVPTPMMPPRASVPYASGLYMIKSADGTKALSSAPSNTSSGQQDTPSMATADPTNMTQWWVYDYGSGTLVSYDAPSASYGRLCLCRTTVDGSSVDFSNYAGSPKLSVKNPSKLIQYNANGRKVLSANAICSNWLIATDGQLIDKTLLVSYDASGSMIPATLAGSLPSRLVATYMGAAAEARATARYTNINFGPSTGDPAAVCKPGKGYSGWDDQSMLEYCSEMDESGYPRRNTDGSCVAWNGCDPTQTPALVGQNFCTQFPWHTACACPNYATNPDYIATKAAFQQSCGASSQFAEGSPDCNVKSTSLDDECPNQKQLSKFYRPPVASGGDQSASGQCTELPDAACWFEPCTGHDNQPNAPLKSASQLGVNCSGMSLNFCSQLVCVLCNAGTVKIGRVINTQVCGQGPPGPHHQPHHGPSPGPSPSPLNKKQKTKILYAALVASGVLVAIVAIGAAVRRGRQTTQP